jgi:hypothetical protein
MTEPRPEPLIFPKGVRFPRDDEFPRGYEAERARITAANITTGWIRKHADGGGFAAYFQVNAHAPRLWSLVRDLAEAILPDAAAPIVALKDEDPVLGPYTTREAAIAVFEPFVEFLQHDGFLAFGLIFQRAGRTEEVFVESVKYLKVWTNQPTAVQAVLRKHALPEVPDLRFIDEYPRVSETLQTTEGNARWPVAFEGLRQAFEQLPPPPEIPNWVS